jgi:hypothetical protein
MAAWATTLLAIGACGGAPLAPTAPPDASGARPDADVSVAKPDADAAPETTPPDGEGIDAALPEAPGRPVPDANTTSDALTSGVCSAGGWCWSDTTLQSNALDAVWGAAADDVWAVGAAGTILHWNGAAWSPSASGTTTELEDVWGSGPADVWAVGAGVVLHWDGQTWSKVVAALGTDLTTESLPLRRVWGTSATDVWALGGVSYPPPPGVPNGAILHWDGSAWAIVPSPNTNELGAIWGAGPNDVWAFAAQSSVVHWDGHAWAAVSIAPAYLYQPTHAWGSGPADIWLATGGSGPLHFDGHAWQTLCDATSCVDANAFWGTSARDVWLVGPAGKAAHWNGTDWTDVQTPTSQDLNAAWGSSPSDVWAVGAAGAIEHWDGSSWSGTGTTDTTTLRGVWASGPGDVWAVGARPPDAWAVHWDGRAWTESVVLAAPATVPNQVPLSEQLSAVWGSAPDDVWAVGTDDGSVGKGQIVHWDGRAWTSFQTPMATSPGFSFPTLALYALWGSGPDDVWAGGGGGGTRTTLHWDGRSWSSVGIASSFGETHGLWGSGRSDVWAVGVLGSILHWDGSDWQEMKASAHFSTNPQTLYAVWGTGPTDVWAVGGTNAYAPGGNEPGIILHFDGASWTEVPTRQAPLVPLFGVWGSGPSDVTAVGGDGIAGDDVLHFDGVAWTASPSGTTQPLRSVWGLGAGALFAVGDGGTFLHR